ncbi:MAG TPA: hypothetical protein VMB03_27650 [Bryobacteraceae bacterium]|nr:hypothetical protein [Bryobacteraceae bacterium]
MQIFAGSVGLLFIMAVLSMGYTAEKVVCFTFPASRGSSLLWKAICTHEV